MRKKISIKIQREVFRNAKYRCEFIDGKTQHRCASSFQLQIDHVKPVWAGGGDDAFNLRCLCGVHNRMIYRKQKGLTN
jgi:hypothetical protein